MLQEIVGTTTDCGRNRRKWNFRQYFTSGFRLISIYDTNNRWAVSFRETNKLFRCHQLHSVQQGPRELCTLVYIHVWAVYTPHTPLLMIPVKSFQYTLYIHVWAVYTPLLIVPVKSVFSYEMCIYTCLSSLYSTSLLIVPVKSEHECVLIWNVIYFFEWKCRSGSYNRDLLQIYFWSWKSLQIEDFFFIFFSLCCFLFAVPVLKGWSEYVRIADKVDPSTHHLRSGEGGS